MSDNVTITPGVGASVAADEIGGVLHQRVKLSLGPNNTAVDAGAGAGAVGTDTQRVTLGSDDPGVVSLAAILATAGAINGAAVVTDANGTLQQYLRGLIVNGVAPTITDYSITNMTGASQSVVAAGNGKKLIYLQALDTNVGTIWISLPGGTAVVGSGVPIVPGGYVTVQPGIANAITGIAATANDDLTVFAG